MSNHSVILVSQVQGHLYLESGLGLSNSRFFGIELLLAWVGQVPGSRCVWIPAGLIN